MTKECLFCRWKVKNGISFRCANPKSNYYNMRIPDNPSFTYCIGFEEKEQAK